MGGGNALYNYAGPTSFDLRSTSIFLHFGVVRLETSVAGRKGTDKTEPPISKDVRSLGYSGRS